MDTSGVQTVIKEGPFSGELWLSCLEVSDVFEALDVLTLLFNSCHVFGNPPLLWSARP